jgi:hypothetical protein
MTSKLNRNKREQLKQLVLECVLSRLTTFEALQYIKQKLGVSISRRYYFDCKQRIKEDSNNKLKYFAENRDAYLFEFFERIQEIEYLQKELWEIHDNAEKNKNKDPKLQLECLRELRQMTITLTDLYNVLPSIEGFEFQYENNNNILLRKDNRINWTDEERKAFEDRALNSRQAKFGDDEDEDNDEEAIF